MAYRGHRIAVSHNIDTIAYQTADISETGHVLNQQWALETDDGFMISTAKNFTADIEAKAKEMGLSEDFLYLNDASSDQLVIKGYGEENMKKLQKVSKKYDPKQVFQKRVTGGFKLW